MMWLRGFLSAVSILFNALTWTLCICVGVFFLDIKSAGMWFLCNSKEEGCLWSVIVREWKEGNMNVWLDQIQPTATQMTRRQVRKACEEGRRHNRYKRLIKGHKEASTDRRADRSRWIGESSLEKLMKVLQRWGGGGEEEVLRKNVYRLWFINSWAISKSSRSSESLWIEAKKEI